MMLRLNKISILGICFSLLLTNCIAQDKTIIEESININSHQIHFYCFGSGPQTIILDVGIGESYKDWLPLLEKVSSKAQIFCYDRAGYGQSEKGSFPRNCNQVADELKLLLNKANIKGPYILLGHSLGAANLQVFATKNMKDIAGIILLDPPPLNWILGKGFPELSKMAQAETKKFESIAESMQNSKDESQIKRADFFYTLASEHKEMFSSSAQQLASIKSFKDIPLIVIASGKLNPAFGTDSTAFQIFWNEQCKVLASKSSIGKYILAVESSHHIYKDNPTIVLNALNKLLSKGKE